jgi:4-hydroxy-tetrahydrodipicolinate synthase
MFASESFCVLCRSNTSCVERHGRINKVQSSASAFQSMIPLSPATLNGTWGTLLLPINADESIDFERLRGEIAALASAGVDGIYSNGTAGEFHTQTEEEFDQISGLLARESERHGVPFQIGVCHMSAQISLARLRRVLHLRPSAVQVVLPDWVSPTIDETVAFLLRMGEVASPIGLVVYNPPHAKRPLAPADWRVLLERVPYIVGAKVAGGDAAWYAEMTPVLRKIAVFVPGHTLATGFAAGATGSYSNVACLSPDGAQRWFALMKSDPARASEWERRIQGFIQRHILPYISEQKFSNPAVDKLLAAIGGWAEIGTRLRWPYRSIPESEAERLRPIARAELPELMEAAGDSTGARSSAQTERSHTSRPT